MPCRRLWEKTHLHPHQHKTPSPTTYSECRITNPFQVRFLIGVSLSPRDRTTMIEPIVLAAALTFCKNPLANQLHEAGFTGRSLPIAWAIVMRESGGNPKSISPTHDYGMFQLNRAAYKNAPWWNAKKLLTPGYNAAVAFDLTQGGKTFYPWDISGTGKYLNRYTSRSTYNKFKEWLVRFPCSGTTSHAH